jgi:hypothetical protein
MRDVILSPLLVEIGGTIGIPAEREVFFLCLLHAILKLDILLVANTSRFKRFQYWRKK